MSLAAQFLNDAEWVWFDYWWVEHPDLDAPPFSDVFAETFPDSGVSDKLRQLGVHFKDGSELILVDGELCVEESR